MQNRQAGFSLLEMLVAFSILSISVMLLLNIFSSGVRYAAVAEDYVLASQIGESLMARIGLEYPLESTHKAGIENDTYHWQYQIEPYFLPLTEIDDSTVQSETSGLFLVQVQVSWESGRESRVIELQALKQEFQQQQPAESQPSMTTTANPFEALIQKAQ